MGTATIIDSEEKVRHRQGEEMQRIWKEEVNKELYLGFLSTIFQKMWYSQESQDEWKAAWNRRSIQLSTAEQFPSNHPAVPTKRALPELTPLIQASLNPLLSPAELGPKPSLEGWPQLGRDWHWEMDWEEQNPNRTQHQSHQEKQEMRMELRMELSCSQTVSQQTTELQPPQIFQLFLDTKIFYIKGYFTSPATLYPWSKVFPPLPTLLCLSLSLPLPYDINCSTSPTPAGESD